MSSLIRDLPGATGEMLAVFDDASLVRAALRFEAALAQRVRRSRPGPGRKRRP